MGRRYKKPPIIEAISEFQFEPEASWDLTIPGLIYEKLQKVLIYSLRNSRKVLRFLQENQFLISLLIEARGYIAKYFPGSMVVLELETDPDEPHSQQLVAAIVTNSSTDEAHQALKQLDEDWWLHALERTQMKLCITVEFK